LSSIFCLFRQFPNSATTEDLTTANAIYNPDKLTFYVLKISLFVSEFC